MRELVGAALETFRTAVGSEHVLVGDAIAPYAKATFATTQVILGVVLPKSRSEVAACVRAANELKIPIYPFSRGRNLGMGSRVPARSGCVVMDLARMTGILEVNEELAYVVVEPGVTFKQLQEHLLKTSSRLLLTVTGGAPDSSLIGNAIERGIGKGPYGDRFTDSVCHFEVVLPNGSIVETGFGRFEGAKAAHVARAASGPYVDGLFTQSGFGIVTRMTMWLVPRPSHLQTFFYAIDSKERLGPLVEVLRELRLEGTLRTPFLLGNDIRFMSFGTQYPWDSMNGQTPLSETALAEMRRKTGIGAWFGEGALFSNSPELAAAERAYVERRLAPYVDALEFWDEERARRNEPTRLMPSPAAAWDNNTYRGVPVAKSSNLTYWRKKTPAPQDMDPDRDGCGVLWFSPALPATAADACALTKLVEDVVREHGYEPNMGLVFITPRCLYMTGALVYDRDLPGEDAKALVCYKDLFQRVAKAGYHPYRLGIQSMDYGVASRSAFDDFLRSLKIAIDPNGVISPGRYEPPRSGQ